MSDGIAAGREITRTSRHDRLSLFAAGFVALLPLWTAAIPSGIAYGVAAREAGLSAVEAQAMSLVIFSAAAQLAAVSQFDAGSSAAAVVITGLALNIQLLLIGVVVQRELRLSWPERLGVASLLTDGAFGVAVARGRLMLPVLLGTGASMFLSWNLGTALGLVSGSLIGSDRLGIGLVVPLAFLAVLVPLVRTRSQFVTALVAAGTVLMAGPNLSPGIVILVAGLAGAIAGALLPDASQSPSVVGGGSDR